MNTHMQTAQLGHEHPDFAEIAELEELELSSVIRDVAAGRLVIVPGRKGTRPVALGRAVRAKVLCNMGTSSQSPDISAEIDKAKLAVDHGASIVCDQSVGRNVAGNRKRLIEALDVPIAAVPLYQNVDDALNSQADALAFSAEQVLETFESQVAGGVTMPGIHAMTTALIEKLESAERLMPLVSRGAGLMSQWMKRHSQENPYFEQLGTVLSIAKRHNVPITFVSSVRAGTVVDGFDSVQKHEWRMLGEVTREAHSAGVPVVVDGLGHMTIDSIGPAVTCFKELCGEVPLGVLGPAVTDRGLGHEHVVNAIGTAIAVWKGANYCNACYPTEHLGLPEMEDVPVGIGASVVAAYSGDLARGMLKERLLPLEEAMSRARQGNQWGLVLHHALEGKMARATFERVGKENEEGKGCSICGDLCPFVVTGRARPRK